MAKSPKRRSSPAPQQPVAPDNMPSVDQLAYLDPAFGQTEQFYGPGRTPTLYNGTPSFLAPQLPVGSYETTPAGQLSPAAATNMTASMFAGTQQSMLPGAQNPMAVYAATNNRFYADPNAQGIAQAAPVRPASAAKS